MSSDPPARVPGSLSWAMLLQFAVGGALIPFVTLLLRDRGLDFSRISQVYLAASATMVVMPFVWGMLADWFLPLNRLLLGLSLGSAAALAWFASQPRLGGLLLGFTLFYATFFPGLVLLNPLCFPHLRDPRTEFGRLRSWGSLGWILPSIPVYVAMSAGGAQDLAFTVYLALGCALAMAVLAWWLPHTPPGAGAALRGDASLGYGEAMKRLLGNTNYLVLLAAYFLMVASFNLLTFYSPPLLVDLGLDRAWIGPAQSVAVIMEIVLFRYRGRLVHRLSYAATLTIGCAALALRHLIFGASHHLGLLVGSYLLAGVVIVFFHIEASLLANTLAGREVRSTAQTLLVVLGSGLGPMFANAMAGWLAAMAGGSLRPVFWFAAALAVLAGALVWLRGERFEQGARASAPTL